MALLTISLHMLCKESALSRKCTVKSALDIGTVTLSSETEVVRPKWEFCT